MGFVSAYETAAGRRYRVRYRKPDHSEGQKRGFKTKRDAELFLSTVEIGKATGQFIDPGASRVLVSELGQQWLRTRVNLKPSSLKPVQSSWRVYVEPKWGGWPIGSISHSEVQAWVSALAADRSATTVLRAYGILAAILDAAVLDKRIPANPARNIKLPRKVSKEHVYLTHQEVERLAQHSGKHATLIYVLSYTGLRWGEAIGLRVKDLDLRGRRISVVVNAVEVGGYIEVGTPKTHKRRAVAIPVFLVPYLQQQVSGKAPTDLVFAGPNGLHMRRTRVSTGSKSWFKTALHMAELDPMTLHDLRHTAASLAISSGANVKAVQRMLGHASAAMTLDTYADLFNDDVDRVATALDRDRSKAIERSSSAL